jgi:hypothetical protein
MSDAAPPPGLIRWRGIVAVFNRLDRQRILTEYDVSPTGRTEVPFAVPLPLPLLFYGTGIDCMPTRCGLITDLWAETDDAGVHLAHGIGIAGGPAAELMRAGEKLACGLDVSSEWIEEVEGIAGKMRIRHNWRPTGITVWPHAAGPSAFPQVEIWHDEPENLTS